MHLTPDKSVGTDPSILRRRVEARAIARIAAEVAGENAAVALAAAAEAGWERDRLAKRAQVAAQSATDKSSVSVTLGPAQTALAAGQEAAPAGEVVSWEAVRAAGAAIVVLLIAKDDRLIALALVTLVAAVGRLVQ